MSVLTERLAAGVAFLAGRGLNLCAVLDCASLPEAISAIVSFADPARLVLLGSAGPRLWQAVHDAGCSGPNPIDDYSKALAQAFVQDYLQTPHWRLLYPGEHVLPLQQLGALAGWHRPSPLGIGINHEVGLWFAYRAVLLIQADLPLTHFDHSQDSPCLTCQERPCETACPAGAVRYGEPFNLTACGDYRLQPQSACADRCLARLACPVATEQRYPLAQVQYHYWRSLASLRAYRLARDAGA